MLIKKITLPSFLSYGIKKLITVNVYKFTVVENIWNDWLTDYTSKVKESIGCDLYNSSNCCSASIHEDTDICSACKEHCDSACIDCEIKDICVNDYKNE